MAWKSGARTLYIEPGSLWENSYIDSFNGKLRDELLDREIFYIRDPARTSSTARGGGSLTYALEVDGGC